MIGEASVAAGKVHDGRAKEVGERNGGPVCGLPCGLGSASDYDAGRRGV
jgi:hypothetical protein